MQIRASKIRYLGARDEQQDVVSLAEVPSGDPAKRAVVAVLTDGIGGLANGRQASEVVNAVVLREVKEALTVSSLQGAEELRDVLRRAAESANAALAGYQQSHGAGRCGTTLLVCVVQGSRMHFLSIGDSLLLALTGAGDLELINTLHSEEVGGRSYLASALLGEAIDRIDEASLDLVADGIRAILLSSDGLPRDNLPGFGDVLSGRSEQKLKDIVDRVHARGEPGQDNLAMILFEFEK